MSNTERKDFVVYAYSDENWEYYYIGKGTPKRPYAKHGNVDRPENVSHIHILEENLDEKTAYEYEKLLISLYGRRGVSPSGKLLNSTNGGGGTSGYTWSEEKLEKISGKNHHKSKERTWLHGVHGLIHQKTSSELAKMFPEDGLAIGSLNSLAAGKFKVYKKWIHIEDDKIDKTLDFEELKVIFDQSYYKEQIKSSKDNRSKIKNGRNNPQHKSRNWCHIKHGFIRDKSCSELVKEFSDTKASIHSLSKMALGKIKYHRGWIFINEDLIDDKKTIEELREEFSPEYALREIEKIDKQRSEANRARAKKGDQNPMYNKRGSLHPSFGRQASKDTKAKISEKARSRFPRRNWYHPIYGRVDNMLICELIEMFPDQGLQQRNLSSVGLGNRKSHKGWTCVD